MPAKILKINFLSNKKYYFRTTSIMKLKNIAFVGVASLNYINTSMACDGHGNFSVPGLIMSDEANRFGLSLNMGTKNSDTGYFQQKISTLSYTHQALDSGLQYGLQVPVINTVSGDGSDLFLGDVKAFAFVPVENALASFSGIYGKVTLPTSGSGHEKGHAHAEADGSVSVNTGLFFMQVLPDGYDVTANADVSYYLPTKSNDTDHHPGQAGSTSPTEPGTTLSSGIGYSANLGVGYTEDRSRIGVRLGQTYLSKKTLGDEVIDSTSNWTISGDGVRMLTHSTSIGLSLTKSLSTSESVGVNAFYEYKF